MKTIMIYPHISSEKGIANYSMNIIKGLRKRGLDISEETFISGKACSLIKKLPRLLKYDIIHLQHEYNLLGGFGIPYFFVLLFLGLFKKKSLIITMHTILSKDQKFTGSKLKTIVRKILYNAQNWWINCTSKLIIVHAKFFKDILVNDYSIQEEKINIIPHGIIENIPQINKEQAKKELNLSGNVFLMIGSMVPDHGIDIILKQADKIGKTILVTSNPFSTTNDRNSEKTKNYAELCKKIVKDNDFDEYVRFDFKEISDELWWKYFNASDIILLPYKGGIGSGIFADAMAMKKPVIASNIKYFREISKRYGCLKIANTNEDFSRVIKQAMNPKNYLKMKKECQRYYNENNLSIIAKKYEGLYDYIEALKNVRYQYE